MWFLCCWRQHLYIITKSIGTFYWCRLKKNNNNVFNFHLSQLRIKIEQAFGLLVNKWRVFKKSLEVNLKCVPRVVECCMRLHNFFINEREQEWAVVEIPEQGLAEHVGSYEEYLDGLDSAGNDQQAGGCVNVRAHVREAIKKQLSSLGLDRPIYNKVQNLVNH